MHGGVEGTRKVGKGRVWMGNMEGGWERQRTRNAVGSEGGWSHGRGRWREGRECEEELRGRMIERRKPRSCEGF